jgi:hypothetical protein
MTSNAASNSNIEFFFQVDNLTIDLSGRYQFFLSKECDIISHYSIHLPNFNKVEIFLVGQTVLITVDFFLIIS